MHEYMSNDLLKNDAALAEILKLVLTGMPIAHDHILVEAKGTPLQLSRALTTCLMLRQI